MPLNNMTDVFPCAENDLHYLQGLTLEPVHREKQGSEVGNSFPLHPQINSPFTPSSAALDNYLSFFQEVYSRPTSSAALGDSSCSLSPLQSTISSPPLPRCDVKQDSLDLDTYSDFKSESRDLTHPRKVRWHSPKRETP